MIPNHRIVNCALCGAKQVVRGFASCCLSNRDDLDLRTPMPIQYMIQGCDNCGYASTVIAEGEPELADLIRKPEYTGCEGVEFPRIKRILLFEDDKKTEDISEAELYYKHALIMLWTGKTTSAYYAFMKAAWCADDNKHDEYKEGFEKCAKQCRARAAGLFDKVLAEAGDDVGLPQRDGFLAMHTDSLRRSGQFKEAAEFAGRFTDDLSLMPLMNYQISLCEKEDDTRHVVNDVYDFYMEHLEEYDSFYEQHKEEVERLKKEYEQ